MTRLKIMNPLKLVFVALGFVFFGLAFAGVFFPVLPTTPFLLLAAFCFSRGSARFDRWFTSTKLYQDYAETFLKHRAMTLKTKIFLCALASTMMLITFFIVPVIWVKILMIGFIVFMLSYFTLRIRTVSPEEDAAIKAEEKALREARAQTPVSLKETVEEVRVMHEEMRDESPAPLQALAAKDERE